MGTGRADRIAGSRPGEDGGDVRANRIAGSGAAMRWWHAGAGTAA